MFYDVLYKQQNCFSVSSLFYSVGGGIMVVRMLAICTWGPEFWNAPPTLKAGHGHLYLQFRVWGRMQEELGSLSHLALPKLGTSSSVKGPISENNRVRHRIHTSDCYMHKCVCHHTSTHTFVKQDAL